MVTKVKYLLESFLLKIFVHLLGFLPLGASSVFGKKIGWCLYFLFSSRNRIARKNLQESFPQYSKEKIEIIVRDSWIHPNLDLRWRWLPAGSRILM
ncbi:MAG: hypothetical protein HYY63_03855 [Elusimicrobia bacterium]|nr:hypothetical protein [Elusimicrobiota bacterium]